MGGKILFFSRTVAVPRVNGVAPLLVSKDPLCCETCRRGLFDVAHLSSVVVSLFCPAGVGLFGSGQVEIGAHGVGAEVRRVSLFG